MTKPIEKGTGRTIKLPGPPWWISGKDPGKGGTWGLYTFSDFCQCRVGGTGSIPGLGRSPGWRNSKPVPYSCLESPMDKGAWWAPWGRKESDINKARRVQCGPSLGTCLNKEGGTKILSCLGSCEPDVLHPCPEFLTFGHISPGLT